MIKRPAIVDFNGGSVSASVELSLVGGKRDYHLSRFVAGTALEIPSNSLLTIDNYYAIVIRHVDTDVNVYGPNPSFLTNYYSNGYAFTAPDMSTNITKIGEFNDLKFSIYSTQDVYVTGFFQIIVNNLGAFATMGINSTASAHIEDAEMKIESQIATQAPASPNLSLRFDSRPFFMPKGGKFEVYLNDDFTDNAYVYGGSMEYRYQPPETNG